MNAAFSMFCLFRPPRNGCVILKRVRKLHPFDLFPMKYKDNRVYKYNQLQQLCYFLSGPESV